MRLSKFSALLWISLAVGLYVAVPAWSAARIHTELLQLRTADGLTLTGVLRQAEPASSKACLIMVHGYGGNFYSGIMENLPGKLTEQGLATLPFNLRTHDLNPQKSLFEQVREDLSAAVAEASRLGYNPIFLHGHSMGTNAVLYFLAAAPRPQVKGAILTGPPGDPYQWNVRVMGKEAATGTLDKAMELANQGKADDLMVINLGPLGKALYTPNYLLSLRGPDRLSNPLQNITKVTQPLVIIRGLADNLIDPQVPELLRQSAPHPEQVELIQIPGADHCFTGQEQVLSEHILRWIAKQAVK
jgi:pimeloyl-ACP methyl ester carboxylesterase